MHRPPRTISLATAVAAIAASAAHAQAIADAFAVQTIEIAGRAVAAEIADFDGDGRAEVMTVVIRGLWPDETREIHVHRVGPDGAIEATPSWSAPLPADAATYDV